MPDWLWGGAAAAGQSAQQAGGGAALDRTDIRHGDLGRRPLPHLPLHRHRQVNRLSLNKHHWHHLRFGAGHRPFLLLGHRGLQAKNRMFNSFTVYIHEEGFFWPKNNHGGQQKLELKPNTSTKIVVRFSREARLGGAGRCVEKPGYSWTSCLTAFLVRQAGCSPRWATRDRDTGLGRKCKQSFYTSAL